MKLGTADLIASADEIVGKPVLTLGGGSTSSGNGPSNRGGGGGDGPRPSSDDLAENETPDPTNKFRILVVSTPDRFDDLWRVDRCLRRDRDQ